MARISGVNIPSGKRIEVALTYVYGIGATRAKQINDVVATIRKEARWVAG